MQHNEGVFYAQTVGYVDNVDGRMWASALKQRVRSAGAPVVAVLDLTDADRLCSTLPRVFVDVLKDDQIAGIALVVTGALASQQARVLDKLVALEGVRVFTGLDMANSYARDLLNPGFGVYALHDRRESSLSTGRFFAYNP